MLLLAVRQTATVPRASLILAALPRASTRIIALANAQQARTCFGRRHFYKHDPHYLRSTRYSNRVVKAKLVQAYWLNKELADSSRRLWGWRLSSSWGKGRRPSDEVPNRRGEEQGPYELSERERQWQLRMEEMRKWIEQDPYKAIFGESNRLGRFGSKGPFGLSRWWAESSESIGESRQAISKPDSKAEAPADVAFNGSGGSDAPCGNGAKYDAADVARMGRGSNNPKTSTIFTEGPLVYDPISNRMVRKGDNEFSHYGQELDVGVEVPVKPYKPQLAATDSPTKTIISMPPAADSSVTANEPARNILAVEPSSISPAQEYSKYKRERFSEVEGRRQWLAKEGFEDQSSQHQILRKDNGIASPHQSKLDKHFGWAQAQADGQEIDTWKPRTTTKIQNVAESELESKVPSAPSTARLQESTSPSRLHNTESQQSEPVERLETVLERLRGYSPKIDITTPSRVATEAHQRHQPYGYDHDRESKQVKRVEPPAQDGLTAAKPMGIERLQRVVNWQWPHTAKAKQLSAGELEQQRKEQKHRNELEGQVKQQKDVMRSIEEGLTRRPSAEASLVLPTEQVEDAAAQMERIQMAEAAKLEQKKRDAALVKEIRDIYEKHYGRIEAEIPQDGNSNIPAEKAKQNISPGSKSTNIETDSTSTFRHPADTLSSVVGMSTASSAADSAPSADKKLPVYETTTTYTVLAYDSSTFTVNSATVTAPPVTTDHVIPLTTALMELSEPAKFLPHLQGLKQQGFEIISSNSNLLVLRQAAVVEKSASSVSALGSTTARSAPLINPIDKTGAHVPTGDFASPTGFVNYNTYEAQVETEDTAGLVKQKEAKVSLQEPETLANTRPRDKPWPKQSNHPRPRRIESVFSGAGRRHFDRRRGRRRVWRLFKNLAATFGIAVAAVYMIGVGSQMKRESRLGNRMVYGQGRSGEDAIREG